MPLKIIEPTDTITVEYPIFTIFGQPGACKTSLGFSAENAILLNYDKESALARAVNRGRSVNVLTVEDHNELVKQTETFFEPFSTVVIDPIGSCVDLMSAAIIARAPKYGRDGGLTLQGFGVLKSDFKTWFTRIRALRKNLLLIAHNKEEKSGDSGYNRPDITGASKDEVMRISDFVGFLYLNGRQRVLDFNPTDAWFGKNPAQWAPWNVPPPDQARTFMAQLFQKGREHLSRESEASAAAARQVDDWRAQATTFTKAAEFNNAIPEVKKLQAVVSAQVSKIMVDIAKTKNITFDPKAKTFSDPEPAKSQPETKSAPQAEPAGATTGGGLF